MPDLRSWRSQASWLGFAAVAFIAVAGVHAADVALWLFDEPTSAPTGTILPDAGPHRFSLRLGDGGEIVPGRFGHAVRMVRRLPDAVSATSKDAALATWRRAPRSVNPIDSPLNVGTGDWTLECWLRIDASAETEGTIFEIGAGPPGDHELLTRFSFVPAESAFVLAGVAAGAPDLLGGGRIEFPNPGGPPSGVVHRVVVTLACAPGDLPRERWIHVAFVHRASARVLRLYVDGKPRALAAAQHEALPHGDDPYMFVGGDAAGRRRFAGAIDELRICDAAVYADEFAPPSSFAANHAR